MMYWRHILSKLWRLLSALVLVMLLVGIPVPQRHVEAQDGVSWMYGAINDLRAGLGLHPYNLNNALMAAAQQQSEWMAATGIVAHEREDGSTPTSRAIANGYGGRLIHENIYAGYQASAADAFNWWLTSSIHYQGIAHTRKTDVGIGIASDGRLMYYTLVFGEGGGGAPPPPPAPEQPEPSEPLTDFGDAPQAAPAEANAEAEADTVEVAAAPPQPTNPPAPTRVPFTWTPSPTVPTLTPTPSWTPTHTWTPSPTVTQPPPTSTAIILPTAQSLSALQPSPTTQIIALAPSVEPIPTATQQAPQSVLVGTAANTDNQGTVELSTRQILLPLLIGLQVMGLGWVLWRLLKK